MMIERLEKIRKDLGIDYHLYTKVVDEKVEWKLFRNYKDPKVYFSEDNKAIMTSEKSTIVELSEFAKKHKRPSFKKEANIHIAYSLIILILAIINIFINNEAIRGFVLGADITLVLLLSVRRIIEDKNFKVDMLEYKDIEKEIQESIKQND